MQKRISALLLVMVIVIGSVLNGNTLKVKAASVAVSEDFAVELTMMIYNLLETVAISSGIKDGLDDYESGSSLYDAFIASVESMAEPPYYDTIITMEDGSKMTVKEALDAVESTLGSNALKLPTSEIFAKYRVISGTGGNEPDPTPTPSSDPDSTPVPDIGYQDPFSYIQDVLVAGTLVTAMAGFFADLYNGKIEGIDSSIYYTGFKGNLEKDESGNYVIRTVSHRLYKNQYNENIDETRTFNLSWSLPVAIFINNEPAYKFIEFNPSNNVFSQPWLWYSYSQTYVDRADKPTYTGNKNDHSILKDGTLSFYSNIPVFETEEQLHSFFLTGSLDGLLNGEAYDFPDLVKSVPEVLQPLTGTKFSPSLLPGINTAVSNAVKSLPETSTDTKANTETYKETMTSTITDVAPKTEVVPQPSTTPGTETGDGFEGDSYKRDLKLIFPFCIPFDFIHFIKALSADPVAPCFKIPIKLDSLGIDMVLELDLAWMDPVMEIFRLGELGCFVIMLMAATKKMIGW